ncbi:MAG: enoyl-CoA hydratase/carnithine racemase [Maribacter sp.]|jgi:enoyl-CoA hydratase/carnithine racemase
MKHYTTEQLTNLHQETFAFIEVAEADNVLTITLDREKKKNAIHPQMVNELAFALQYAKEERNVWVVVFQSKGNVFCAGADLKAFMGMLGEYNSSIPNPEGEVLIGELFNKVHKPIIAKVEGDVYAGGFFFLSGSTYVVALDGIKLGLPEVKRGLYPFQVMASLLRVMPQRKVIDWCIRGYNLTVEKAQEYGLVTHITNQENIEETIQGIIDNLKANSPSAIRMGLEAFDKIQDSSSDHKYLYDMLMKTVATKDAQEGIMAFKEKRKPIWTGE